MAAGDGLVTMTPTSIVVAGAGSSASIQSDGSVDFTSATSLSLNGVFVSGIDNYLVVWRSTLSTGSEDVNGKLRLSGTDTTGSNYASQYLYANSTNRTGARSTSQTSFIISSISATAMSGFNLHLYGPSLAQPTAMRSVTVLGDSSAAIYDIAATHSLSTAYDGISFIPGAQNMTGTVAVFGYEE